MAEVLRLNELRPKVFVEPFAGGASVALQLLASDLVDNIALGERDPLLAAFWQTVFTDAEWLIEVIRRIPVTLERWNYFRNGKFRTRRDRALACIFLNRTSFSGILSQTAGPIGGRAQSSQYKIGCRFPVSTLERRIRQAAALRARVLLVKNASWEDTVANVEAQGYRQGEIFYYLDPPFYQKADRLYRYHFSEKDHQTLHDVIVTIRQPWLLSYDPAEQVVDMYAHNGTGPKTVDLLYSARAGNLIQTKELIIANVPHLPAFTRLWRSSEEWRSLRLSASTESRARQSVLREER